jgi:hypothetical protein
MFFLHIGFGLFFPEASCSICPQSRLQMSDNATQSISGWNSLRNLPSRPEELPSLAQQIAQFVREGQ